MVSETTRGSRLMNTSKADMNEKELQALKDVIGKLTGEVNELKGVVYKNNFTSTQNFNKAAIFSDRLRVPVYTVAPTVAEVGDLMAISGKLYICTVASQSGSGAVWTVVGTQV